MKHADCKSDAGFSLVEIMASVVILGLLIVPICSAITLAYRINSASEELLDAEMAVSSTVEQLMSTGVDPADLPDGVEAVPAGEDCYEVTVRSGSVEVTTYIRGVTP